MLSTVTKISLPWLFLVVLCGELSAQLTGGFTGTVQDRFGAAVPNALVEIVNTATNEKTSVRADFAGRFGSINLLGGAYKLTVSSPGFKEYHTTVLIRDNESSYLDIKLDVGNVTETVSVSSGGESTNVSEPVSNNPTPIWNAWTENFGPAVEFNPLSTLRPRTDYNIVLDLSALSYGDTAGLYSQKAGKDLRAWLKSVKKKSASLDVLIVPDQYAFEPQRDTERSKGLIIDIEKASKAQRKTFKIGKGQVFGILKHDKNPQFVFGRLVARVTTTTKLGAASIALMIWSNGKPIDELTLPVCVNDGSITCTTQGQVAVTLKGIDSIRIAATAGTSALPDAAIHLIELDSSHLVGVFKCNTCTDPNDQDFKTWQIRGTAEELSKYVTATNLADFEGAVTDADYLQHAEELYIELFRDGATGQLASTESDFRKFILQHAHHDASVAPSIFIRLLPGSTKPLFLVPLGNL